MTRPVVELSKDFIDLLWYDAGGRVLHCSDTVVNDLCRMAYATPVKSLPGSCPLQFFTAVVRQEDQAPDADCPVEQSGVLQAVARKIAERKVLRSDLVISVTRDLRTGDLLAEVSAVLSPAEPYVLSDQP